MGAPDYLNESYIKGIFEDEEKFLEISKEICGDILKGLYEIHVLVENLGFALVSPSVELRSHGTKLLSEIISHMPTNYLNEIQLGFIVAFYSDRIKDHHSVLPAVLRGLDLILKMENIPAGSVKKILTNLFQHTSCQSQTRADRKKYYEILEFVSNNCAEDIKEIGVDFVYGVINSIDGERDPRNLLFLYEFMYKFIQKYQLYHLTQEMFEVFACYFPIDFTPTTIEAETITREILADKLSECLAASRDFIPWTVELTLDKLDSDLILAKLDSLDLIKRLSDKYPAAALQEHFDPIWKALMSELLPGSNNVDVKKSALATLHSILCNASTDKEISKNFQTTIFAAVLAHFSDPHHRLFVPASAIMLVCVRGDPFFAAEKALSPLLLKLESNDCDNEQSVQIVSTMTEILQVCISRSAKTAISPLVYDKIQNVLKDFMEGNECDKELNEAVMHCLLEVCDILDEKGRCTAYKFLYKHLVAEEKEVLRKIVQRFSSIYPDELKEQCISMIIENFETFTQSAQRNIYSNLSILIESDSFKIIILNLILKNIYESQKTESQEAALTALKAILNSAQNNNIKEELWSEFNIIEKMIDFARQKKLSYNILVEISNILSIVTRHLNKTDQRNVVDKFLPTINLDVDADLFLTRGIFGFMQGDIDSHELFEKLVKDLIAYSLVANDERMQELCNSMLAGIFNNAELTERNEGIFNSVVSQLQNESKEERTTSLNALSWIAQGLLYRGHPKADELIKTMIEHLDHPTLKLEAVRGFQILTKESTHLLNVKLLVKQKLFCIFVNKAETKLKENSESHMNAFIYILQVTPMKVLKMYWKMVGPIIIKCLETEQLTTVEIALTLNKTFLSSQDDYFSSHFSHLIPQFLKLTKYESKMRIRILALECLEAMTKYPSYTVLPYKTDVILGLNTVLDDKKRFVRNTAVRVRNLWFTTAGSQT